MPAIQLFTATPWLNNSNEPFIRLESYLVEADDVKKAWQQIKDNHKVYNVRGAYAQALPRGITIGLGTELTREGKVDATKDMTYAEFDVWVKTTVHQFFDENGDVAFRHPTTGEILPDLYIPVFDGPETLLQWAVRKFVTAEAYPFKPSQFPHHYEPLEMLEGLELDMAMVEAVLYEPGLENAMKKVLRQPDYRAGHTTVGEEITNLWNHAEEDFSPFNSDETLEQWQQRMVASALDEMGVYDRPDFHVLLDLLDDWPRKMDVTNAEGLCLAIERHSSLRSVDYAEMTVNDVRNRLWAIASA